MAGNQSRGLIAASKTKGWDPTEIPGAPGVLANFDKDQGNITILGDNSCLGTLPEGIHDTYKDGYDVPPLSADQGITWTAPDYSRETPKHTTNTPAGPMGE